MNRRTYVQVGMGGRSTMFIDAVTKTQSQYAELLAVCDTNPGRVRVGQEEAQANGVTVAGYAACDFEKMISEHRPDVVIVTTMDSTHVDYICRSMELGCDVITEKPMTTDAASCQRILDVKQRTGKSCTVTFNYRFAPNNSEVKRLLMSGVIGNILSVDFEWMLNTCHGADYFRRWHRNKGNSGGLLVHKSTHHFDLVNWWLSDVPVSVFATGARQFYTPETADRYGLTHRGERCTGCPELSRCSFSLDLDGGTENLRKRYRACESHDGYYRDRCVFLPENGKAMKAGVDTEDTLHAVVAYAGGATLSYSLVAYAAWEGYSVSFTGSTGRLEYRVGETAYVNGDGTTPGELVRDMSSIKVYPHWKTAYSPEILAGIGGHGGADPVMLATIFDPSSAEDDLMRTADQRSGAYSILCGIAGNESMKTGAPVQVDDLVQNIGLPDYPSMPTGKEAMNLECDGVDKLKESAT